MDKEKILRMKAGRKLDALVAEHIMGWHKVEKEVPSKDCTYIWQTKNNKFASCECQFTPSGNPTEFSMSASFAWLAIQELRKDFWCFEIKIADGFLVVMELLRTPPIKVEVEVNKFQQITTAICKAALIAKLEVKDG